MGAHSGLKRAPLVLGAADGLTLILGLTAGLARMPHALVHAAISGGLAELVGMSAAVWLSDAKGGFLVALGCGIATLAACVIPVLPYVFTGGWEALSASLVLVCLVGAAVSWLRPERGWLAVAETYGVLLAAAVLCFAASLI
jgi:VIT1/CCC1 family predicted Fe2+/Mn2+ transporter